MRTNNELGVLSLFTGAGGLDLGLEAAGFSTRLCVEKCQDAIETILFNRGEWQISQERDALKFARDPVRALKNAGVRRSEIVLLAGGPPCQPFSKASYWTEYGPTRMDDPRASTISAYLKVVEKVRPEVLLFENVGAFAFTNRNEGLIALERGIEKINRKHRTKYVTQLLQLNAADYGVPQLRERIFVLAHRSGKCLTLPKPTHGPRSESGEKYLSAWDAIGSLNDSPFAEDLCLKGRWAELIPSIPEGQNYLWHTPRNSGNGAKPLFGWRTRFWSFLLKLSKEQPSWTISANPGPATGPFHWSNRQLSLEELCLLQTFPRGYEIKGPSRSARRQIGNAVPAALSELLGLEIRRQLLGHRVRTAPKLLPRRRDDCPPKESIRSVPRKYWSLCASHLDHPGTGLGPSALRRKPKQVHVNQG